MRPKKTAAEQRILVERLFYELVAARHKLPPRRVQILPNAHEPYSHLVGGYNFMTDVLSRPSERGRRHGKRAEEDSSSCLYSGSETDEPDLGEKDVKKKRSKKQKTHRHRKRLWVPLWEGDIAEMAAYLAKAVNMTEEEVETSLKEAKAKTKEGKKPTIRCLKWKTQGCSFKCQVNVLGAAVTVMSLGVHKHETKVAAAVVKEIPDAVDEAVFSEVATEPTLPSLVETSAFDAGDDSLRRLKHVETEDCSSPAPQCSVKYLVRPADLDLPISSPSLLPLPSAEEDNSAALQALAAWKPPEPSSEDDENEGDEPSAHHEEDHERKAIEERSLERERHNERVEREEMLDSEEEENREPRVDDHAMFTGFEPGFLETDESTTYHAIGTIGDDGRTCGSDDEDEGDEDEGDDV